MKLFLSQAAAAALEALPEGLEKAQIRGALTRLAMNDATDPYCPSSEVPGGRFFFVGPEDKWKITYRLVELENEEADLEEVISVVKIKERRTHHWATEFYPKGDCQ